MNTVKSNKYRGLSISITLFIFLIIGILGLTLYGNRLAIQDQNELNLTHQMRDDISTVARSLYMLRLNYSESPFEPVMKHAIERVREKSVRLTQGLDVLREGGKIALSVGEAQVSPLRNSKDLEDIGQILKSWTPLKKAVDEYLAGVFKRTSSIGPLSVATDLTQFNGYAIYYSLGQLAARIESKAQKRELILATVQLGGITVTILYFIIFIFIFVRRLRRTDNEVEAARQETSEIMQTIHEGLFLVDQNLQIGQQTSTQLARIIPGKSFGGQNLEDMLSSVVDEKDLENTCRFIRQLFNERIDEQLIESLNPLQKIMVKNESRGNIDIRYVRFLFTRVWEDDSIKRILASVTDITEEVLLEQRIEKERQQNEQHIELLMKVLRISPPLLASFLRNARSLTERVNTTLRRTDRGTGDLKTKAREIFRDIHGFKGEASALGLEHFVDSCEAIEDRLQELQKKRQISGEEFMQVTISLDNLIDNIMTMENIQANIHQITHSGPNSDSVVEEIKGYYTRFAENVAERNNKEVVMDISDYDTSGMDETDHDLVKEIIVQLMRNAIVHGIEDSGIRQTENKTPEGHLRLSLSKGEREYRLVFEDDGFGINYAAVRERVKKMPLYADKPETVDEMDNETLNRFIFVSGLSTLQKSNNDAGRGMGMDVIKEKLRQLNAHIALRSVPEQGTKFVIRIPRKGN